MKVYTYRTPKALEKKIDEYFEETDFEKYTISGLCLHLHIVKNTLYEYGKREGFKQVVELARLKIENSYEMDFRTKGRSADIFAMKNFGWKENKEEDVDTDDEETSGVIVIPQVTSDEGEVMQQ